MSPFSSLLRTTVPCPDVQPPGHSKPPTLLTPWGVSLTDGRQLTGVGACGYNIEVSYRKGNSP